jgi:hypothetical protein
MLLKVSLLGHYAASLGLQFWHLKGLQHLGLLGPEDEGTMIP